MRGGEGGEQVGVGAGAADRPMAAEKLQPHVLLHPLDFPDGNRADLAGGTHMGATAGAPIEIPNRDDPERALAVRSLPEPRCRRRLLEGHLHGPVLGDGRVGARLGLHDLRVAQACGVEIERRALPAEMHAHGRVSEALGDHRGEQVLAGVLLHVVEAACPVDRAGEPVAQRQVTRRRARCGRPRRSRRRLPRRRAGRCRTAGPRKWGRRRSGRGRCGGRRRRELRRWRRRW